MPIVTYEHPSIYGTLMKQASLSTYLSFQFHFLSRSPFRILFPTLCPFLFLPPPIDPRAQLRPDLLLLLQAQTSRQPTRA